MNDILSIATDARQSDEWGEFLKAIGWEVKKIDGMLIYHRKIPLFNASFIKIQHVKGPISLVKIDAFARKNRALFSVIEPHTAGYNEDDWRRNGYRVSKMRYAHSATILIDLTRTEETIMASFSENARRNIRKAERQLTVESGSLTDAVIRQFYAMYLRLGKRKKFYVPPFAEVKAKMNSFAKTSVVFFAYEVKDKEPVAALWVGSVGRTIIYFHPGNTDRGYDLLANYLLVWEAMKWGKKKGMQVFDFETAYDTRYPWENKKWLGYTEFKKKFGGQFVEFPPSYVKFYNPLMKGIYLFGTMLSK
jgi:lipid II:glycine glycyltransferase (peptidoglycan interpeptide bridge formation enzyme)